MKKIKPTLKVLCIGAVIVSALSAGAVVIARSAVKNDDMKYTVNIIDNSDSSIIQEIPIGIGVRGDADSDKKVSVRDAALIAKYLSKVSVDKNYMPQFKTSLGGAMADVNKDGKISVRDAAAIAKYLASADPNKDWDN